MGAFLFHRGRLARFFLPALHADAQLPVLLICDFFPSGDEFQAASGISSRTVERKAVSKAATAFRLVSVSW
jgi:hypothetical protein